MRPALDGRREARNLARLYGSPHVTYDDALIAGGDEGVKKGTAKLTSCSDSNTKRVPSNWRGRLPAPANWFAFNVPCMVIREGIGIAPCPLHADRERSFTVNLTGSKGTWHCTTCGHGDMLGFVMRRYGMKFVDAVRFLVKEVRP